MVAAAFKECGLSWDAEGGGAECTAVPGNGAAKEKKDGNRLEIHCKIYPTWLGGLEAVVLLGVMCDN